MRNWIVLLAVIGVAVVAMWQVFGWEVGLGMTLMLAVAAAVDVAWRPITGHTVSEWVWLRWRNQAAIVIAATTLAAVALILHFLGGK